MLTRRFCAALALAAATLTSLPIARADVALSHLFSDGAVLQRGAPIPIWGTADDGEKISVMIAGDTATTTAGGGKWHLALNPLPAGGPYTLVATGHNTVTVNNVYVGDVWLCSGQSNMGFPLREASTGPAAIANSADSLLHWYNVPNRTPADTPQDDVNGAWFTIGPSTATGVSAVAYFFARDLRKDLSVPIGIIEAQAAGTPAEAWTSRPALMANPALAAALTRNDGYFAAYPDAQKTYQAKLAQYDADKAAGNAVGDPPAPPRVPSKARGAAALFNAMINPLIPYALKGVLWYQGEDNAGRAREYAILLPTMIADWRRRWGSGDLPFIVVQIPGFQAKVDQPQESMWAQLREAQWQASQLLPCVGLVVTTKFGDEKVIHPTNKEPVGDRAALMARSLAYGENVEASGPVFDSLRTDGAKAIVRFTHAVGLTTDTEVTGDSAVSGFTLAGADRVYHNAVATIDGDSVNVSSPDVESPVSLRYGWANFPLGNLVNGAGLPASPFRTDHPPLPTLTSP